MGCVMRIHSVKTILGIAVIIGLVYASAAVAQEPDWSKGTSWQEGTKLKSGDFKAAPPPLKENAEENLDGESDVKVFPGDVDCNFATGEMTYKEPSHIFSQPTLS